jgi:DNA replicative helicase MCM subunit Mcm2 (Cdc46/Mcm family)
MTDSSLNQLVTDLARDLVKEIAPEELPLFRANSEAYFRNPEKAFKSQKTKEEMLGFGITETATFLTPIALAILTDVLKFLGEEIKKSFQDQSTELINESAKKMFKKLHSEDKKDNQPVALTADQLEEVRKLALKKARLLKLSDARAKLLADSIVGSLAVTPD